MPPVHPNHATPDVLRRRLLSTACHLLSAYGEEPWPLRVTIRGGLNAANVLSFTAGRPSDTIASVLPIGTTEADAMEAWLAQRLFTQEERRIILAVGTNSVSAAQISRSLHESSETPSSRLKTILPMLCERGLLHLHRDGYRVTEPRVLELARLGDPPAN